MMPSHTGRHHEERDDACTASSSARKPIDGFSDNPRGRRPDTFKDHWEEMMQCLEQHPDQTALEPLIEFQARYPGRYSLRQLHTLQKRVRMWRRQAVQRLIGEVTSNILGEATGNKIT